jgi:hypothetical protein
VVRSSIKNDPPWTTCFCSTTADIKFSLLAIGLGPLALVLNFVLGTLYFDLQRPKTKVQRPTVKVQSSTFKFFQIFQRRPCHRRRTS